MILVTGATGRVGSALVEALPPGTAVRAASRSGDGSAAREVDWVRFSFSEPSTFAPALEGIRAVFLIRPPQMAKAADFEPFLDALEDRSIRRLVLLSVKGADRNPLLPHRGLEKRVMGQSFDWTILRPSDFMQNLETVHAQGIRERNEIAVPAGDGRSAFIDVADIGAVASQVLLEEGHGGRGYDLTGPAALSFSEIAAILSDILDRPIVYRKTGIFKFTGEHRDEGIPMALVMSALYTVQRLGFAAEVTEDLPGLLGRPATRLEDYAERQRSVWLPTATTATTPERS
ncbi:MAG TPA: NAD(P)H-binding protein [Devosia sp.]|nr:NAD(P)H-binding protein [Devosia sp.]